MSAQPNLQAAGVAFCRHYHPCRFHGHINSVLAFVMSNRQYLLRLASGFSDLDQMSAVSLSSRLSYGKEIPIDPLASTVRSPYLNSSPSLWLPLPNLPIQPHHHCLRVLSDPRSCYAEPRLKMVDSSGSSPRLKSLMAYLSGTLVSKWYASPYH